MKAALYQISYIPCLFNLHATTNIKNRHGV